MFIALTLTLGAITGVGAVKDDSRNKGKIIVIGHRGASGHRPEHTIEAYRLAIQEGADFVEPDIVSTKDGVLVARHENEISGTTDVANHPEFAARKVTKLIDGVMVTGWFTEDFTLAELKTLFARERLPALRSTSFDGRFRVPTLQEVIDLVKEHNATAGKDRSRLVGIYPETKHPTYFDDIGLSMEEPLVQTLRANGYTEREDLAFIQSFETANLRQLRHMTRVRLVQLLDAAGRPYDFVKSGDPRTYADLATPAGLGGIATYADGIGVNKSLMIPRDAGNKLLSPTTLIDDAHVKGLIVHGWTFRAENSFLPVDFRIGSNAGDLGDLPAEIDAFLEEGMDGFFTDFPGIGNAARDAFNKTK
jgi:glycerophosphoryl diester phosphodiesterase